MREHKRTDFYAIILSIFYVLLGLVLIIWPDSSALAICYAVGALVTVCGFFYIISYFLQNHYSAFLGRSLSIGLVLLVVGIFVLFRAEEILKAMPFLFGILLLFDSANKIQAAFDLKRVEVTQWKIPLLIGIITASLGLILVWNPFSAIVMLNIFIGVCLIINAVANLLSSLLIARRWHENSNHDKDE